MSFLENCATCKHNTCKGTVNATLIWCNLKKRLIEYDQKCDNYEDRIIEKKVEGWKTKA